MVVYLLQVFIHEHMVDYQLASPVENDYSLSSFLMRKMQFNYVHAVQSQYYYPFLYLFEMFYYSLYHNRHLCIHFQKIHKTRTILINIILFFVCIQVIKNEKCMYSKFVLKQFMYIVEIC